MISPEAHTKKKEEILEKVQKLKNMEKTCQEKLLECDQIKL